MTDEQPVEPSAIFASDGSRVPYRNEPPAASILPALIRAAADGRFLTASVLALVGAAAAATRAAELVGRMAAGPAVDVDRGRHTVPGGPVVSWTRLELRWPG